MRSSSPSGVATFAMTAAGLGTAGVITTNIAKLFLAGLPVLLIGTRLGLKLYGYLDEATFRKMVLVLLLVSGAALIL